MKIPKTFIPKKNVSIESLLRKSRINNSENEVMEYNMYTVMDLLENCQKFVWELKDSYKLDKIYEIGEDLAKKTSFTAWDINELSKRIVIKYDSERYLGFYLSALVNKIIKESNNIILEPKEELFGIGAYQQEGTTVVKGNIGYFAGHFLGGGTLIVEGNTGNSTGNGMELGKIVITGEAGKYTGDFMTGGEIIAYGEIKSIGSNCKGTIYSMGKKVWPK